MNFVKAKEFWIVVTSTILIGEFIAYITEGAITAGLGYVVGAIVGLVIIEVIRFLRETRKRRETILINKD